MGESGNGLPTLKNVSISGRPESFNLAVGIGNMDFRKAAWAPSK